MHARVNALLHAGAPAHHLWTAWSWSPGIVFPLVVAAFLYGRGLRLLWDEHVGRGIRVWEATCFAAGWIIAAFALVSPLHALAEQLFAAHMIQHELLMVVAAPLLVLGRPLIPMLWAFPSPTRRRIGAWVRQPRVRTVWRALAPPGIAFTVHGAAIWLWHAPPLFEATLANDTVHAAQHASFFGTALLFWWAIVQTRAPNGRPRAAGFGVAVLLLFGTAVHTSALGALLTFSRTLWYPAYGSAAAAWGLSPWEDQQLAGLIMWIPASVGYLVAALLLFSAWLRASEHHVHERESARGPGIERSAGEWR